MSARRRARAALAWLVAGALWTGACASRPVEPSVTAIPPDETALREGAREALRAGAFALAESQLERVLKLTPQDAVAHVYYGDLFRLRAQQAGAVAERDALAQKALHEYEDAARLDPTLAEPYRQLGLLYYQQRDEARARQAFEKYLTLAPDAPDAARVRGYVYELSR